jgi:hypothetical protein
LDSVWPGDRGFLAICSLALCFHDATWVRTGRHGHAGRFGCDEHVKAEGARLATRTTPPGSWAGGLTPAEPDR